MQRLEEEVLICIAPHASSELLIAVRSERILANVMKCEVEMPYLTNSPGSAHQNRMQI